MKLTLRPEWRLRPLSSFLGFMDLKTGVIVALLFALLNKVAAQLSLYIYSVLALIALVWGLRAITQEDPKNSLYFAHLFFADHVLSTAWTVFFGVVWWVYTPHDGRRTTNSAVQEEIAREGIIINGGTHNMTEEERAYAAMEIWNEEKGTATTIIILGWLAKIYFALLLYSYAIHLRKGSYRSLPYTRVSSSPHHQHSASYGGTSALANIPDEEEEVEDFYRLPVRAPPTPSSAGHTRTSSYPNGHARSSSAPISPFGDFVTAPGRGRRSTYVSASGSTSSRRGGSASDEDRVPLVGGASTRRPPRTPV
ncbi:hypothetical protein ABKN59_008710 [Abortiporus biennis]